MRPTCYVSHSIRGVYGEKATDEQMKENCDRAVTFASEMRISFPMIDFYVPGECDEFVQKAYRMGYLTERQILTVDCELIRKRDMLLLYAPDLYKSGGMRYEEEFARSIGKPTITLERWSPSEAERFERHVLQNHVSYVAGCKRWLGL